MASALEKGKESGLFDDDKRSDPDVRQEKPQAITANDIADPDAGLSPEECAEHVRQCSVCCL